MGNALDVIISGVPEEKKSAIAGALIETINIGNRQYSDLNVIMEKIGELYAKDAKRFLAKMENLSSAGPEYKEALKKEIQDYFIAKCRELKSMERTKDHEKIINFIDELKINSIDQVKVGAAGDPLQIETKYAAVIVKTLFRDEFIKDISSQLEVLGITGKSVKVENLNNTLVNSIHVAVDTAEAKIERNPEEAITKYAKPENLDTADNYLRNMKNYVKAVGTDAGKEMYMKCRDILFKVREAVKDTEAIGDPLKPFADKHSVKQAQITAGMKSPVQNKEITHGIGSMKMAGL
ncbi:MAG: hypothetical protein HPY53_01225 [Brevinematales bacterium]|nr:hypothetical protein [Brevinematales bacterium]